MKGRYEPEGMMQATRDIIMMLGQEDDISGYRWRLIDNVVRGLLGMEPQALGEGVE